MRKMIWKIPAKIFGERSPNSEDRDHTKLTCFEALRAQCLNCQNFIISDPISKKSVLYFRTEQDRPNMSVYPSLEDMKVDHMMQVQSFNLEKVRKNDLRDDAFTDLVSPFNFTLHANQAQEQGAGLIPAPSTGSFAAHTAPTAPTAPSGSNYPGLAEYMGLELTEAEVRANMPEYLPAVVQVAKPLLGFFPREVRKK